MYVPLRFIGIPVVNSGELIILKKIFYIFTKKIKTSENLAYFNKGIYPTEKLNFLPGNTNLSEKEDYLLVNFWFQMSIVFLSFYFPAAIFFLNRSHVYISHFVRKYHSVNYENVWVTNHFLMTRNFYGTYVLREGLKS